MNDNDLLLKEFEGIGFTKNELESIVSGYKKTTVKKGDFLLKAGQISDAYYFITDGFIRSFVINYEGEEVTTNFFSKNSLIIEESSFFLKLPSKEYIQALSDCILWSKHVTVFNEHFNEFEKYREWGREHLVKNFFALKERSLAMITDTATDRYQNLLKNRPEVIQKAPLKQIASFLGITDTSLSRIRKELAN